MDEIEQSDRDNAAVVVVQDPDGLWWANYRASAFGAGCMRALVAIRQGMQTMQPPGWMLEKFQQGKDYEDAALGLVAEQGGWSLYGEPDEAIEPIVVIPAAEGKVGARIVGHTDRYGTHEHWGPGVIEVKCFAPSTYETWRAKHWAAFPYYAWQVSTYMHAMQMPCAFGVALKTEDGSALTGDIDLTVVTEPLVPLEKIMSRVVTIEYEAGGLLPAECDVRQFPCPTYYLCSQPEWNSAELQGEDLETVRSALAAYITARDAEGKAKRAKEAAGAKMRERLEVGSKWSGSEGTVSLTPVAGRSFLDEAAMEADGIDVGRYRRFGEPSDRLNVTAPAKGRAPRKKVDA